MQLHVSDYLSQFLSDCRLLVKVVEVPLINTHIVVDLLNSGPQRLAPRS